MTNPTPDDEIDEMILDIAHAASFIERGKTVSAYIFPEARQRLIALKHQWQTEARKDTLENLLNNSTLVVHRCCGVHIEAVNMLEELRAILGREEK